MSFESDEMNLAAKNILLKLQKRNPDIKISARKDEAKKIVLYIFFIKQSWWKPSKLQAQLLFKNVLDIASKQDVLHISLAVLNIDLRDDEIQKDLLVTCNVYFPNHEVHLERHELEVYS
jgi:hypothetical protein